MSDISRELRTDFTGDADSLAKESKRAADSLGLVEDETRQLGRTMSMADDDIEAMADALEQSLRQSDRAKDSLAKMRAEIRRLSDSGDDIGSVGRQLHDVADDAGDAGREVGQEFKQNLGESLSSGDLSGLITDTLGGLVAGLEGTAGIAFAGLAAGAALLLGNVKKSVEEWNAEIEATTEGFWQTELEQLGDAIGETVIELNSAKLAAAELDRLWEESPDKMAELVEQARLLNVNANDVLLARAGDEAAIRRVKAAADDYYDATNGLIGVQAEQLGAWNDINKAIDLGGTSLDQNKARVEAYNDSLPEVAAAHALIGDKIDEWAAGVQKTADEVETLRQAFERNPLDLEVRLNVDAAALRQYFPYGVGGGWSDSWGPKPQGMAGPGMAPAGAGAVPAPVVTNHWAVTINGASDPDASVRTLDRWARDNGRPASVTTVAS